MCVSVCLCVCVCVYVCVVCAFVCMSVCVLQHICMFSFLAREKKNLEIELEG